MGTVMRFTATCLDCGGHIKCRKAYNYAKAQDKEQWGYLCGDCKQSRKDKGIPIEPLRRVIDNGDEVEDIPLEEEPDTFHDSREEAEIFNQENPE